MEQFSPLLNILLIPFRTVHKAVFFVLFQSQNFIQQRIISTDIYYKPPQRTSIQVLIESSHWTSLKKKSRWKDVICPSIQGLSSTINFLHRSRFLCIKGLHQQSPSLKQYTLPQHKFLYYSSAVTVISLCIIQPHRAFFNKGKINWSHCYSNCCVQIPNTKYYGRFPKRY